MDDNVRSGGKDALRTAPVVDRTPGWQAHREAQIAAWCEATRAQRLAWLEEALAFARAAGAFPRARP